MGLSPSLSPSTSSPPVGRQLGDGRMIVCIRAPAVEAGTASAAMLIFVRR